MAQPTSLPGEPQAGDPRSAPPASSVPPTSPTKSLWKRLLNRSASAHPEEPLKSPTAAPPLLPQPERSSAVQPAHHEAPPLIPDAIVPTEPAHGDLLNGSDAAAAPAPALDVDGGAAAKTVSNSRRAPQRDVVPGLPRAQTFARQQAELRGNLMPIIPTPAERRGVSVDRRLTRSVSSPSSSQILMDPRTSAPNIPYRPQTGYFDPAEPTTDATPEVVPPVPPIPLLAAMVASSSEPPMSDAAVDDTAAVTNGGDAHHDDSTLAPPPQIPALNGDHDHGAHDAHSIPGDIAKESNHCETASMTSSQYEHRIRYELEHIWILNLSMHFRDKSRREKFFVTYRQRPDLTRRVTVSLDYRNAPDGSLEMDLLNTKLQRDKNEMIYEAIRESLVDIQFYTTVTNLKLQTNEGRLHVHVVEDTTEIIDYPSTRFVQHLSCHKIRESEVEFDSHMSGFVYKVRVGGRVLIKKDIPGPDSVDEFLYEVNALNSLRDSQNVIELYGVIIGDDDRVRGLLISYAEQGALIDILYENNHGIPWYTRMKWARQIVHGLSEIHEAGFVQGDFTLSNIVIDDDGNAKIIDINRRGCPVGWEPPEATPLIQSDQRISMYIGVKSDLYQLGMVLWALATQEDDPEAHGRPLYLPEDVGVPQWYRSIVATCLAEDPRERSQALQLLSYFPRPSSGPAHRFDDSDYEDEWVHGSSHHPTFYAHSAPSGGSIDDGPNAYRHRTAGIESVPSAGEYINADDADVGEPQFTERPRAQFVGDKFATSMTPIIRSVTPSTDWAYVNNFGHTYVDPTNGVSNEPYYYPTRGRSPPRRGASGSARRDGSWVRERPPDQHTWAEDEVLREARVEYSPSRSLPEVEPLDLNDSKEEEVKEVVKEAVEASALDELPKVEEVAEAKEVEIPKEIVEPLASIPTKEDEVAPAEVSETMLKETSEPQVEEPAKDEAVHEEKAAPDTLVSNDDVVKIPPPEAEVELPVIEEGACKDSPIENKEPAIPSSPERPGDSNYSLTNDAPAHEAIHPEPPAYQEASDTTNTGSNTAVLDQIKGVGAVYEEAESCPRHINLAHDEKKQGAIEDRPLDRVDDGLNALVTTT